MKTAGDGGELWRPPFPYILPAVISFSNKTLYSSNCKELSLFFDRKKHPVMCLPPAVCLKTDTYLVSFVKLQSLTGHKTAVIDIYKKRGRSKCSFKKGQGK